MNTTVKSRDALLSFEFDHPKNIGLSTLMHNLLALAGANADLHCGRKTRLHLLIVECMHV